MNDSISKGIPNLRFNKLIVQEDTAKIEFEYKYEGAFGRVNLIRQPDNSWKVTEGKIVER